MTNEERDIITQFIGRVAGAQTQAQPAFGGSVPATTTPPLPPVDPEADSLIRDMFNRYPAAPYRITQLAFVQEHALTEAQNRIQRLEWELQQAQQAAQQAQQQQRSSGSGGGFFSGLFGGGARPAAPPQQGAPAWNQGGPQPGYNPGYQQAAPPPPQYAPNYQPGMFQRGGGSGFLGSALTTAAGVAGGLVAGNALMNLFSGSHSMGGGFGGAPMVGSPWGGPTEQPAGYVDQGTWTDPAAGGQTDPGYVDTGSWDTSGGSDQSSSWTDNSGGGGDSSWDTGSSSSGSDDDTF